MWCLRGIGSTHQKIVAGLRTAAARLLRHEIVSSRVSELVMIFQHDFRHRNL
ncbi:hypothetical protein CCP3SC15_1960004 [Gammaproteobacteria bacterium]